MDYFKKYEENVFSELEWNLPERKQGVVTVAGGNAQSFRIVIKTAERLGAYPIEEIRVVLPGVLSEKLPAVPGLIFLKSTESGSLADGAELAAALDKADFNILVGDLSRNSTTMQAAAWACQNTTKPLIVTRDTVDLLAEKVKDRTLMNENLIIMASVAQLQKLLRAIYYPKMLAISQSLVQVAELLHKFTLSYPVTVATLHNGQLLVARFGEVAAVPLEKSGHSPLTLWQGGLAAKIAAYGLYNPGNLLQAIICACFSN